MVEQEEVHRKCFSADSKDRIEALKDIRHRFNSFPDRQRAWNDLINLTCDDDPSVNSNAASILSTIFLHVPDKEIAWVDLHRLATDKSTSVRKNVALAIGFNFSHIVDKKQAWEDLHKLSLDENSSVRKCASSAIGASFAQITDKESTWIDLYRLSKDENKSVRSSAITSIVSVFPHIPNKEQAWEVLHGLTNSEDSFKRNCGALALGSVFSHLFKKQELMDDLLRLSADEDRTVRMNANHSLGKISILKASQENNPEDYRKELERAIIYFEKASKEPIKPNPAEFCLPFYRSFHAILFEREEAREEVDKCLAETKEVTRGSKRRELLFEAVKNLSNALKEVQKLENLDFEAKKEELNFYRKYCDRAAELMRDTEEEAPFATATMRKGLPILDRKLKSLLEEIQEKAKNACRESQGTDNKEIAIAVNKEVQKWELCSQEEMTEKIEELLLVLESKIPNVPENEEVLSQIKRMRTEKEISKQYNILSHVIPLIPLVQTEVNAIREETITQNNIREKAEKENKVSITLNYKLSTFTLLSLAICAILIEFNIILSNKEWILLIIIISLLYYVGLKFGIWRD